MSEKTPPPAGASENSSRLIKAWGVGSVLIVFSLIASANGSKIPTITSWVEGNGKALWAILDKGFHDQEKAAKAEGARAQRGLEEFTRSQFSFLSAQSASMETCVDIFPSQRTVPDAKGTPSVVDVYVARTTGDYRKLLKLRKARTVSKPERSKPGQLRASAKRCGVLVQ